MQQNFNSAGSHVIQALYPYRPLQILRYTSELKSYNWKELAVHQQSKVQGFIQNLPTDELRFALFGINYIPLAIHLGHLLNLRYHVQLYEYERYQKTWEWLPEDNKDEEIFIENIPKKNSNSTNPVVLRFSISGEVTESQVQQIIKDSYNDIHIRLKTPELGRFRSFKLVNELSEKLKLLFESIRKYHKHTERIHIFAAVPNSAALLIGRYIQLPMDPEITIYYYERSSTPNYSPALILSPKEPYCVR